MNAGVCVMPPVLGMSKVPSQSAWARILDLMIVGCREREKPSIPTHGQIALLCLQRGDILFSPAHLLLPAPCIALPPLSPLTMEILHFFAVVVLAPLFATHHAAPRS